MHYRFFNIYKWRNLKPDSPHEQTRNMWLYKFGAFARYQGIWFPCKVLKISTIGEPAVISAIPVGTDNLSIYPQGQIRADQCDVIYSVFSDGTSIQAYVQHAISRIRRTGRMLDSAINRSLNTELLFAPKRLLKEVKKAANREDKAESFVITVNSRDEIGSIELPRTIDIVEKLWDSNDWAVQELSQLLGISYNPSHGKKERMIQNELLGDRDLTIMNREMITSRLITAAKEFGEYVIHISTEVDTTDRQLKYGGEDLENDNIISGTDTE